VPTGVDPAAHVHEGVELLVSIQEPRIGARGSLVPSRIACEAPEHLSADEARRLAETLTRAAELADEADRKLLPILEHYGETRDAILAAETA
jgi:hypothetical protein